METKDIFTEAFCCPVPLARVSHKSKQIEVAPRFYYLDKRMQDFVMFQIQFLVENNNDFFDADIKALKKVMEKYPDTKKSWFLKEFSSTLLAEKNNDFTFKRIRRLFEYLNFEWKYSTLIQKIKNFLK